MAFRKEILRNWRIENKLSQTEAARILSVTQAFYSHLEVGRKSPSLGTLEIISERTKIPISNLLDTQNPTLPPSVRRRIAKRAGARKEAVNA